MLNAVYPLLFATTADAARDRAGSAWVPYSPHSGWARSLARCSGRKSCIPVGGFDAASAYRMVYHVWLGLPLSSCLLGRESRPRDEKLLSRDQELDS
jgi:hypothetical protein